MLNGEATRTALQCVGVNPRLLDRDDDFRRLQRERRATLTASQTRLGHLRALGAWELSALYSSVPTRTTVPIPDKTPPKPLSSTEEATVLFLGERVLRHATALLPHRFENFARNWPTMPDFLQRDTIAEVARWCAEANCGGALPVRDDAIPSVLFLAFVVRAGMMSAVALPIERWAELERALRTKLAEHIELCAKVHSLDVPTGVRRLFRNAPFETNDTRRALNACVATRRCGWYYVDVTRPTMSRIDIKMQLDEHVLSLRQLGGLFPGFTVQVGADEQLREVRFKHWYDAAELVQRGMELAFASASSDTQRLLTLLRDATFTTRYAQAAGLDAEQSAQITSLMQQSSINGPASAVALLNLNKRLANHLRRAQEHSANAQLLIGVREFASTLLDGAWAQFERASVERALTHNECDLSFDIGNPTPIVGREAILWGASQKGATALQRAEAELAPMFSDYRTLRLVRHDVKNNHRALAEHALNALPFQEESDMIRTREQALKDKSKKTPKAKK